MDSNGFSNVAVTNWAVPNPLNLGEVFVS